MGDLPDPGLPGIMAVKQVVVASAAAAAAVVLIVLVVVLVLVLESGVISGRCLLHILLFSLTCSHRNAAGQHDGRIMCSVSISSRRPSSETMCNGNSQHAEQTQL